MKLAGLMFVQYFLVVANTRAFTQGNYAWTAATDAVLLVSGFFTTQLVARAKSKSAMIWYIVGGTIGSQVAIYITKLVYGS